MILNITASAGTPKVKPKDVVKKGDVLVSGEIIVENNNSESTEPTKEYVHARADVTAKTSYDINFDVPYEYIQKKYTGHSKKTYGIECFNQKIKFFSGIKFKNYEKISKINQLNITSKYPLPIKFFYDEYKEFIPQKKIRTINQAKDLADKIVTSRIIREFDLDTDICDKKYKFIDTDRALKVYTVISATEKIDKQVKINE